MQNKIQKYKECYVCGRCESLHEHHIFYGYSNRKNSEKYGMKVWLCFEHHNGSNEGVHFNKALDLRIKKEAQAIFEKELGSRQDFMAIFGKNYL